MPGLPLALSLAQSTLGVQCDRFTLGAFAMAAARTESRKVEKPLTNGACVVEPPQGCAQRARQAERAAHHEETLMAQRQMGMPWVLCVLPTLKRHHECPNGGQNMSPCMCSAGVPEALPCWRRPGTGPPHRHHWTPHSALHQNGTPEDRTAHPASWTRVLALTTVCGTCVLAGIPRCSTPDSEDASQLGGQEMVQWRT